MMSKNAVIFELDRLLQPLGFSRHTATWNRKAESLVDVIDVQVRKAGDAITVNAGVLDNDVHTVLWGKEPPEVIEQPICTVRARIGELLDGKEKWWLLMDGEAASNVAGDIRACVLPFLERMHTRSAIEQWLIDTNVIQKKYPEPIITLAILKVLSGDSAQGCGLLAQLQRMPIGGWQARASGVATRLRCT